MNNIKKGDRVIAHNSVWERYDNNHDKFVCYLKCPIGCDKVTKI